MALFNECMNSVYLFGLLTLTEFNSQQTHEFRKAQGWLLVVLCLFTVFVNLCNLLILTLIAAVNYLIKKYQQYIEKQRKMKIQEDATFMKSNYTDNTRFVQDLEEVKDDGALPEGRHKKKKGKNKNKKKKL
jgi:predicted membrane protein